MAVTIKDALAEYLINELKKIADLKNQNFRTAIDVQSDQDRFIYFQFEKDFINNTQGENIIEYIPSALNFEDDPAGIKNIDKTLWTITYEFGFTGLEDNDIDFLNQKSAVEEFRKQLNNNPRFTVVSGTDTYNCRLRATSLSRSGEIKPMAGYKRILKTMIINIVSGIGIKFGEDEIWQLQNLSAVNPYTYTELDFITKTFNETPSFKTRHLYDESHSINAPESVAYNGEFELEFDENNLIHWDLWGRAKGESSITTIYDLRIIKPFGINPDPLNYKVYIQIQNPADNGIDIKLKGYIYNATNV